MTTSSITQNLTAKPVSKGQLVLLLITNLIPLFGAIFLDWSVFTIIFLFWLENAIIGIFNVPKMLLCKGAIVRKLPMAFFFVIHYGFFTSGHGLFLLDIFDKNFNGGPLDVWSWALSWISQLDGQLWLAVLAIVAYWLFDFTQFALAQRDRKDIGQQMVEPYSRVVIAHVVLLAGAMLSMRLGGELPILVILIIVKTGIGYFDLQKREKQRIKDLQKQTAQSTE